jgi:SAM-dependent methyltransferase
VTSVYDRAAAYSPTPHVLDLGAGEGSVTLPFLELGAAVTAVDISEAQLRDLQAKCGSYMGRLEIRCQDVSAALQSLLRAGKQYDLVVANSFLHHIPDYLGLIRQAVEILRPHGEFFSFQDPIRYESLGTFSSAFCKLAYFSWRITKGDVWGGIKRRMRRARGVYLDSCPQDNVEYHAMRGGVDQDALASLLGHLGLHCQVIRYFSTQSRIWQPVGAALGIANTFALRACKSPRPE